MEKKKKIVHILYKFVLLIEYAFCLSCVSQEIEDDRKIYEAPVPLHFRNIFNIKDFTAQ